MGSWPAAVRSAWPGLRFCSSVLAAGGLLGDLLGVTLCRSKGLLTGGDALRSGRVGGSERLGPNCLGLSFGPLGAFGGGSVRRLEYLGRLGAERFGNPMSLQRLREHGFDLGDPGCQHIALATDDIFATAAALRERGFAAMPLSPNYFDDLAARFDLAPETLERMRQESILYDADGAGEFFQLYSRPFAGQLFIEIVERRGGYAGYGAPNAPFRIAAQKRLQRPKGMPAA